VVEVVQLAEERPDVKPRGLLLEQDAIWRPNGSSTRQLPFLTLPKGANFDSGD
jgi:hypothetical protein